MGMCNTGGRRKGCKIKEGDTGVYSNSSPSPALDEEWWVEKAAGEQK